MNILNAANGKNTRIAAMLYANQGISILPLNGKKATGKWTAAQEKPMSPNQAAHIWTQHPEYNVGIVLGKVSGIVAVDLDGIEAVNLYERTFPQLCETFTVRTGSHKGLHLYYRPTVVIPNTTRIVGLPEGNIELRSNGTYVVAPPSTHPDTGNRYTVDLPVEPMKLDDLDNVVRWIVGMIRDRRQKQAPAQPARPSVLRTIGEVRYPRRYALAALKRECDALAAATEGSRNDQLNTAAYNLGQLVGVGWLSPGEVETRLLAIAITGGLSETEAAKTIQSGLQAGSSDDRIKQWSRR